VVVASESVLVLSRNKIAVLACLVLALAGCAVDAQGAPGPEGEDSEALAGKPRLHVQGLSLPAQFGSELSLRDTPVAIYRRPIASMKELSPVLEAAAREQKPLLIVSLHALSDTLLDELAALNHAGLTQVYAVSLAGAGADAQGLLERLSHVAAATPFDSDTRLEDVTLEDLGYAGSVLLTADGLSMVAGR
jgi:hypothetical protein